MTPQSSRYQDVKEAALREFSEEMDGTLHEYFECSTFANRNRWLVFRFVGPEGTIQRNAVRAKSLSEARNAIRCCACDFWIADEFSSNA